MMRPCHRAALVLMLAVASSAFAEDKSTCDINSGPCSATLDDGMTVAFDISPKPALPMTEKMFTVKVSRKGLPIDDATVSTDISMPGMVMGKNVVRMQHRGHGLYEGTGVIMRCMTGRKDWEATVVIERLRKKSIARFRFEVR